MTMKAIIFAPTAARDLRRHGNQAKRIVAKVTEYATTGAGDIKDLAGMAGKRLRVGDFRVIFEENEIEVRVTKIGPRSSIYN